MTLGGAPEALTIGYLRNQRLIGSLDEIAAVQVDWEVNAVASPPVTAIRHRRQPHGQAHGHHRLRPGHGIRRSDGGHRQHSPAGGSQHAEATLYGLLDAVRHHESIYKQAGAVHGCALAQGSEILMFVEDVGRHNAVDAIAGKMWLDGLDGGDKIFYTTGRLTSEMVIKTAQMGIPFLVSRSGLTQMGWEIARQLGMTMIGRAQGKHYLLFTGEERFTER
jgi:FdhD protein